MAEKLEQKMKYTASLTRGKAHILAEYKQDTGTDLTIK